jgi:hypothetical protein
MMTDQNLTAARPGVDGVNWIARSNQLAQQRGIGAGFELFAKQKGHRRSLAISGQDLRCFWLVFRHQQKDQQTGLFTSGRIEPTWVLCNENTAAIGSSGFDSPIGNGHAVAQPGRAEAFAGEDEMKRHSFRA